MSFESFTKSQLYTRKSKNLDKLGFDYSNDPKTEYLKIQSIIYSLYHIKCESMLTIMKKFNIPSSRTMDIIFNHFDVEPRSLSEAGTNAYNQHRSVLPSNYIFKTTYHTTWENKIVYLRSSYELELAKLLDSQKISYDVECLRIKYFDTQEQRYRISVPDFYLPQEHKIIEVKSDYWLNEINMRDKQKSYAELGYKFSLYLNFNLIENW
jgi:hypothetical protein